MNPVRQQLARWHDAGLSPPPSSVAVGTAGFGAGMLIGAVLAFLILNLSTPRRARQ